ncbi:MAG: hypothetical protein NC092_09015 [Butyrivibrio sp.]|nr:hypothetical protein [Muribaculum sp.]MCM1552815.1 hypothetical protein [Butyrivibrio sp.]
MSAKTKIVVLHMKELIYTGVFAALGILLVILLVVMFLPGKEEETPATPDTPPQTEEPATDTVTTTSAAPYIPGIYTTELVLGGQTIDVEVIVSQEAISSIRLVNLSESVTTMYPLLEPALESICSQVYETQSLENISYTSDNKYTSLVLIEAIRNSLNKAQAVKTTETIN